MKKIVSLMRKAIEDYNMINDGDKIAVGVSGGKDSLTLLLALSKLSTFYPKKFEVIGLSLDMGFEGADYSKIQKLCDENNIKYIVKKTNIAEVVFDIRKEKNPCSLCAKLRRGALNDLAIDYGFKKIALGHHNDDVLETFFLSLFYEGRINCFSPVTYLDRKDIHTIRPLIYVPEKNIKGVEKRYDLPVLHNPCPANGKTKRQYIKELIKDLDYQNKGLKVRMFGALQRSYLKGWNLENNNYNNNYNIE